MEIETNKIYSRTEDMSHDGSLRIIIQTDGDIIIAAWGHGISGQSCQAQVEFCALGSGGGRSPHTRKALVALVKAMEKDNQESPIRS